MSKKLVIQKLSELNNQTKEQTKRFVDNFLTVVGEVLSEESSATFLHFGTFNAKKTPPRTMRSPSTGKSIDVPEGLRISFKPAKSFVKKVKEMSSE